MLDKEEKKTLEMFLVSEIKKTKHYSVMKSRRLISIAVKLKLDSVDEMKELYYEFYKNKY